MKRHKLFILGLLVTCGALLGTSVASAQMAVTTAAALEGTYGLQATSTNGAKVYVEDDSPAGETHFLARFWFDANDYSLSDNSQDHETVRIMQAHDATTGIAVLRIYLIRRQSSTGAQTYRIKAYSRRDDGVMEISGGLSLANIPRQVEIEWQASSAPGANDGFVRLNRADHAAFTKELLNLDNDTYTIGSVRLGIFGGDGQGTMFFDSYESFR